MAYPTKLLNPGEKLMLDLRPHWWFIVKAVVALAAAIILGIIVLVVTDNDILRILVGLVVLVALGYFVARYVRWAGINFVVTDDRVIYRTGVVAKRGIEIPLEQISTVFFEQSLFERMIGAGDLAIESASEGGRQAFEDVRKPMSVQQEIYRAKEANDQKDLDRIGHAASGGSASPSIPEQIEQLDELRQRGVVSAEEFEAKKRDLLNRM